MFKEVITKISGLKLIWGKVDQMKVNKMSHPHIKESINLWYILNLNVNVFKYFYKLENKPQRFNVNEFKREN